MKARATLLALTFLIAGLGAGAREVRSINNGWFIKPLAKNQNRDKYVKVNLPYTWNAEYLKGGTDYNREAYAFRRRINIGETKGKRHYLHFEGVNSYCDLFVNGRFITSHKGGYTAFCVEITDFVQPGDNMVELWVSNAFRSDVLPLIGDFVVCGGIHRPCSLIITAEDCITPDFYASPGVLVEQVKVGSKAASFKVRTLVSSSAYEGLSVRTTISSPDGKQVFSGSAKAASETVIAGVLENPALWHGRNAPNLYTVCSELLRDGTVVDQVSVTTGFRSLAADPDKGILLNGEPYPVRGFGRHEDVEGRGSALLEADYRTDVALMLETGATAARLTHYPHGEKMYELADSTGLLLWTEIPLCGPGGWQFAGYIGSEELRLSARENLKELVYQKFNHPSICFWGIFNEILYSDGKRYTDYGDPVPFVNELGTLYKELDPSRLTTFATCEDEGPYLGCSDLVAWNKYYGWYEPMSEAEAFFDGIKEKCSPYPFGISEYGAGASLVHHADSVDLDASAKRAFHPEERQNAVHEQMWSIIKQRPWIWGAFVWNLADFRSNVRREGDTMGMNDKGLVTYDRSVRKDAFYFYKAEWTDEPVLYITSRRHNHRTSPVTGVKVYTNQPKATLYLNGKKVSEKKNDGLSRIEWKEITLAKGDNEIRVISGKGKLEDRVVWTLE
ncbi:MAG: glycoside hydrolase family 2 TIM barrel-domain containing protein [Bacteroidales bacterium]|nr:glycoside hydrolase family 2 TIM barrel-domain containing protein [Bacteroidales bacterium]